MSVLYGRPKPLNMIEQPQWPEIRKGPPRFVKAKRTNKVDVGSVVMDADYYPETWGHAVLTNSWTDNKTKYGQRPNHTTVVNEEFRPPPEDLEDLLPISRSKRQVVFGRINPGGGYTKSQNTSLAQVDGWLKEDDRVVEGSIAPTFESNITFFEPEREPLLAKVLPDYSITAGEHHPTKDEINPPMHITLDESIPPVYVHAGFEAPFGAGTPFEVTDLKLERKQPELSVSSRGNTLPVFTPRELPIYEYTLPQPGEVTVREAARALTFPKMERDLEPVGPSLETPLTAGFESEYREFKAPKVKQVSESKLPAHQRGAGYSSSYSEPVKDRKHHPEARRNLPATGFYRLPEAQIGTRTPNDLGQGGWATRHQGKVTARECEKADPGLGKMPTRFVPTTPQFHQKSDAMRHHVQVPSSARPGGTKVM